MIHVKASYRDFIGFLEHEGYTGKPFSINHTGLMVTAYYLNKQFTGQVITIRCPSDGIITICGIAGSGVDPKDFKNNPMLYEVPHEFSILCLDEKGKEPAPETQVRIQKVNINSMYTDIDTVYYGDLSIKDGSRFKRKEERYYFKYSITLRGGEILKLNLICPNVNISMTELLMKCDLHRKEN